MHEEAFELSELISGYLLCTLTIEEEERLLFLLEEDKERYKLLKSYKNAMEVEGRLKSMHDFDVDKAWIKIDNHIEKAKNNGKSLFVFYQRVAIVLVIIGASLLYSLNRSDPRIVQSVSKTHQNDVLPGTQKAKLVLSDGKEVELDGAQKSINAENGVTVVSNNGEITYNSQKATLPEKLQYNTLIIPKAGTYSIILPDGSKVVLNAMSELKFPVSFMEKERKVVLKGEAYFEVAKDALHPFKVQLDGSEVEVLGTHFNISSYGETAKTTLLEGAVKVRNNNGFNVLIPGKQAVANRTNIIVSKGDTEKAVAWCKGDFYFNNDAIEPALLEISRWYDLKLIYKKALPSIHISGHISRQAKLSEVVNMLEDVSSLSFRIENKSLIIN